MEEHSVEIGIVLWILDLLGIALFAVEHFEAVRFAVAALWLN